MLSPSVGSCTAVLRARPVRVTLVLHIDTVLDQLLLSITLMSCAIFSTAVSFGIDSDFELVTTCFQDGAVLLHLVHFRLALLLQLAADAW